VCLAPAGDLGVGQAFAAQERAHLPVATLVGLDDDAAFVVCAEAAALWLGADFWVGLRVGVRG